MNGFGNGLVFALVTLTACDGDQSAKTSKWLILMPRVDQEQITSPVSLKTSEHWDKRLNTGAEIADPGLTKSTPLMAKLIRCGPQSVTMISSEATADAVDMPVRYAVVGRERSDGLENCLRSALPLALK